MLRSIGRLADWQTGREDRDVSDVGEVVEG